LIPVAGVFGQFEIGDQVDKFFISNVPPSDCQHWTELLPSEQNVGQAQTHARLQKQILKGELFIIIKNGIAGCSASIFPIKINQFSL
jgi:hypothetical protein